MNRTNLIKIFLLVVFILSLVSISSAVELGETLVTNEDLVNSFAQLNSLEKVDIDYSIPGFEPDFKIVPPLDKRAVIVDSSSWQEVMKATTLATRVSETTCPDNYKEDQLFSYIKKGNLDDFNSVEVAHLCAMPLLISENDDFYSMKKFLSDYYDVEFHRTNLYASEKIFNYLMFFGEANPAPGVNSLQTRFSKSVNTVGTSLSSISSSSYFDLDFTKNSKIIVVADNDYVSAMHATIAASYLNAPVFILGFDDSTKVKNLFPGKNVILFTPTKAIDDSGALTSKASDLVKQIFADKNWDALSAFSLDKAGMEKTEKFHREIRGMQSNDFTSNSISKIPIENKVIVFNSLDYKDAFCKSPKPYIKYLTYYGINDPSKTNIGCKDSLIVPYLAVVRNEFIQPISTQTTTDDPTKLKSIDDFNNYFSVIKNKKPLGSLWITQTKDALFNYFKIFQSLKAGEKIKHFVEKPVELNDTYVTFVGSPENIPFSTMDDNAVPIEMFLFSKKFIDKEKLLSSSVKTGYLFGLTVSDTSTLVATNIFLPFIYEKSSEIDDPTRDKSKTLSNKYGPAFTQLFGRLKTQSYRIWLSSSETINPLQDLPSRIHLGLRNFKFLTERYNLPTIKKIEDDTYDKSILEKRTIEIQDLLFGITFPSNKADISIKSGNILCNQILPLINSLNPESVIIKGHADYTGSEERNKVLSKERADAVYNHLKSCPGAVLVGKWGKDSYGSSEPKEITDKLVSICKKRIVASVNPFSKDFCNELSNNVNKGQRLDFNFIQKLIAINPDYEWQALELDRQIEFDITAKTVIEKEKKVVDKSEFFKPGLVFSDILYYVGTQVPFSDYKDIEARSKPFLKTFFIFEAPNSLSDRGDEPSLALQLIRLGAAGVYGYDGKVGLFSQIRMLPDVLSTDLKSSYKAGDLAFDLNKKMIEIFPPAKVLKAYFEGNVVPLDTSKMARLDSSYYKKLRFIGDPLSDLIPETAPREVVSIIGGIKGGDVPTSRHEILFVGFDKSKLLVSDVNSDLVINKNFVEGSYAYTYLDYNFSKRIRSEINPMMYGKDAILTVLVQSPYPIEAKLNLEFDTKYLSGSFRTTYYGLKSMNCKMVGPMKTVYSKGLLNLSSISTNNKVIKFEQHKDYNPVQTGVENANDVDYNLWSCTYKMGSESISKINEMSKKGTYYNIQADLIAQIYVYDKDQPSVVRLDSAAISLFTKNPYNIYSYYPSDSVEKIKTIDKTKTMFTIKSDKILNEEGKLEGSFNFNNFKTNFESSSSKVSYVLSSDPVAKTTACVSAKSYTGGVASLFNLDRTVSYEVVVQSNHLKNGYLKMNTAGVTGESFSFDIKSALTKDKFNLNSFESDKILSELVQITIYPIVTVEVKSVPVSLQAYCDTETYRKSALYEESLVSSYEMPAGGESYFVPLVDVLNKGILKESQKPFVFTKN